MEICNFFKTERVKVEFLATTNIKSETNQNYMRKISISHIFFFTVLNLSRFTFHMEQYSRNRHPTDWFVTMVFIWEKLNSMDLRSELFERCKLLIFGFEAQLFSSLNTRKCEVTYLCIE